MEDLDILANKFKEWRGNRRHCQYPKQFWDEIQLVSQNYPIPVIAKALNISASYLRHKLVNSPKPLTFAPVNVTSFSPSVSIEFTDSCCRVMKVKFEATPDQLVNMIQALAGKIT
jgi:hypothetical protein